MKYLLYICLLCTASLQAQIKFEQMNANELVLYWLMNDCGVEDGPVITQLLAGQVKAVEPLFLRAYQEGPGPEQLLQVEERARQNFSAIQKALESGTDFGLSEEDLAVARRQTVDDFVKTEREKFVLGFRSQALLGLAAGGGEEGRKFLSDIAEKDKSALGRTARYGLQKME